METLKAVISIRFSGSYKKRELIREFNSIQFTDRQSQCDFDFDLNSIQRFIRTRIQKTIQYLSVKQIRFVTKQGLASRRCVIVTVIFRV
jgi:hypothetical protein